MAERKPTAVWCTPHAYRSAAKLGAHHLTARLAARGWNVLLLSNPVSPLHVLKARERDMRIRLKQAGEHIRAVGPNLHSLMPVTVLPMAGRLGAGSRWMLDHWPQFTVPSLRATLRKAGFDHPDLRVMDGPVAAPMIELLKPKRSAMRVLDRLSGFASSTPVLLEALADLSRRVDLVTYSAHDLHDELQALNPKRTAYLGNGVTTAHFGGNHPPPADYAAIQEPRIVYVGTMAEWFDFDLVASAARQRPNMSFVLIGPPEMARQRLPVLPNLHLLGPISWENIAPYLQHAHAGIIPFDARNHPALIAGVNPIKLYEYAAAGLPVVSVDWPELRRLNAPIELVDGAEAFVTALNRTVAASPAREILKAFAGQHDWDMVLARLLNLLDLDGLKS